MELAWPVVALIAVGAAYRLVTLALSARQRAEDVAGIVARLAALETTRQEMSDALEASLAMTMKLAEFDDRISAMEMRAGMERQ